MASGATTILCGSRRSRDLCESDGTKPSCFTGTRFGRNRLRDRGTYCRFRWFRSVTGDVMERFRMQCGGVGAALVWVLIASRRRTRPGSHTRFRQRAHHPDCRPCHRTRHPRRPRHDHHSRLVLTGTEVPAGRGTPRPGRQSRSCPGSWIRTVTSAARRAPTRRGRFSPMSACSTRSTRAAPASRARWPAASRPST